MNCCRWLMPQNTNGSPNFFVWDHRYFYAITKHRSLSASSTGIAEFQFKIISSNGQSIYYYYPFKSAHAKSFNNFYDDIGTAISFAAETTVVDGDGLSSEQNFKWLETYKRDDQSAIDRNIADGKVTLKKRESKFREELERHEHEYIVYKDFT